MYGPRERPVRQKHVGFASLGSPGLFHNFLCRAFPHLVVAEQIVTLQHRGHCAHQCVGPLDLDGLNLTESEDREKRTNEVHNECESCVTKMNSRNNGSAIQARARMTKNPKMRTIVPVRNVNLWESTAAD